MRILLAAMIALGLTTAASAQQAATSAFQGFSGKSDEPVNVEADNLELREKEQAAVFSGNVFAKQGDSTLKSRKLTIFYYDKDKPADQAKPAADAKPDAAARPTQQEASGPSGPQDGQGRDIKRMEADGDVVVTSKDQRATGEHGVFDTASNTVVMTGGVVVSQGDNVVRGDSLHVNLTTQTSRVEGTKGSRVQGVFKPRARDQAAPAAGAVKR